MEIRNINTLVADLLDELETHERLGREIFDAKTGAKAQQVIMYQDIKVGVRMIQDRFLRAMEQGQLDYKKTNRE